MDLRAASVDELTDVLGRLVRQAALPRFLEHVAARAGTSLEQSAYVLLVLLAEQPWPVKGLADAVNLDVSTVSRQVQALEDARLAHREPHPTDRRSSLVVIDDDGRAALDAHRRARRAIFAELLSDVPSDALYEVTKVLDHLANGIESFGTRPLPEDPGLLVDAPRGGGRLTRGRPSARRGSSSRRAGRRS